jgi:DNA-directed RNA polymerase specialized sigma24 family protein
MTAAKKLPIPESVEPQYAEYAALLSDDQVRFFLEGKVWALQLENESDAEDIVSDTFAALWRRRLDADPPDSIERMMGLARVVVEGKIVDFFRHRKVMEEDEVDAATLVPRDAIDQPIGTKACDQPTYIELINPGRTVTAEDHVRAKEKLEFTQKVGPQVGLNDDLVEVMQAVDAGEVTIDQAARERGIKPGALRVRMHRVRQGLAVAWAKHLAIRSTTVVVFIMLTLLVLYTVVLAGIRRNEPPRPRPPRTVEPRLRNDAPTYLREPVPPPPSPRPKP